MSQDVPPLYASARPHVNIITPGGESKSSVKLPSVFLTPIRLDVVRFVHTNMRKNSRQPYAVSLLSGHQVNFSISDPKKLFINTYQFIILLDFCRILGYW